MKPQNRVRKDANTTQPQSNTIQKPGGSLRLPADAKAQLALYASQIAVPPGTLARLAILSVLHSLDDSDVLQGFADQARGEVLVKCPEATNGVPLNAN